MFPWEFSTNTKETIYSLMVWFWPSIKEIPSSQVNSSFL
jgi:hypothetical protein